MVFRRFGRFCVDRKVYPYWICAVFFFSILALFLVSGAAFSTSIKNRKWQEVVKEAPFPGRSGHASAVFNGKLFVSGGWNGAGVNGDISYSIDGQEWLSYPMPMGARAGHSMIVFGNMMWLIGGITFAQDGMIVDLNDVWVTADGYNWNVVTAHAPFSARAGLSVTVHNNRLYVIGGVASSADVWSTADGVNWYCHTAAAPFGSRGGHAIASFNGKLWLIGGINIDADNNFNSFNDVWSSDDGSTWECVVQHTDFFAGGGHTCVVFDDALWVIGGFRKAGAVFVSRDGVKWSEYEMSTGYGDRVAHTCVEFNGTLWIIGGFDGSGHKSDVWCYKSPDEEVSVETAMK